MKTSTITKSALALALGLCASGAYAVTVTPVYEDFDVASDATVTGLNGRTNLTWAVEGDGDASIVSATNEKLELDTGEAVVSATMTAVTNDIATAIADGYGATFSANVSFVPATEAPTVADTNNDLKFALYALASAGSTNLCVLANGGSHTVTALGSVTDQNIEIAFTAADTFTVKVGAGSANGPYTFKNSGSIAKVEFQGNGTVDDLAFAYNYNAAASGTAPRMSGEGGSSHTLTATEANYLNELVEKKGAAAVETALAGTTVETFEKATLLNQDVTAANAGTYTFNITKISKSSDTVSVKVALTRSGTVLGAIRGTASLFTCATPNGTYTKENSIDINESQLSNGETTVVFTAK